MEFLEVPVIDEEIYKMLARFAINLVSLSFVVIFAILPNQRDREFAFSAIMLNVIVFFICFELKKLQLDLGLALGLFAVFGVLRYRTDAIRVKELTYLFVVIGIAVLNSLANKTTSYAEVAVVNGLIIMAAVFKEVLMRPQTPSADGTDFEDNKGKQEGKGDPSKKLPKYTIEYDRLEWLGEAHQQVLIEDLRSRTGLDVRKVEVKSIDLLNNKVLLTVWTGPSSQDRSQQPNQN